VSVLNRLFLIILSLGTLAAAVVLLLFAVDVNGQWQTGLIAQVSQFPGNLIAGALAVIFGLLAIRFLFYRTGGREVQYVSIPSDGGQIRISFDTLKALTNRIAAGVKGVQELETKVRHGQNGVLLAVRVSALPDIDLTEMSMKVQESVKEYVERTAGVVVERVIISVTELARGQGRVHQKAWVD